MKFLIIAAFSLVLTFFIFSFVPMKEPYRISRGEELVNITLDKSARIIKEKYGLRPFGSGAAMPGGPIQKLRLCFMTNSLYSKEQLREILIKTAQELLDQVTENQEIQQYIKEPPFTIRNIDIIIYNHDHRGRDIYDPDITVADINNDVLSYRTKSQDKIYGYKNIFQESYEEALKALSSSTSDNSR